MYGTSVMKTAVLGLLERNSPEKHSTVRLKVVPSVRRYDLDPEIRKRVEKGSELFTDKLRSYENLDDEYVHQVIDHAEAYAKGRCPYERIGELLEPAQALASKAPTLTLSRSICFGIWMNRHSGLTSARTMILAGS